MTNFWASRTVAPLHYLPFTDSDGVQLDGWVIEPVIGYDPSKRYPAILDVHGGPKTVYGEVFFHEMQLWASEGYFVFFCNPRGGDGRGNEFADIRGKRYGVWDYNDLMEFTDHVLQSYPQIDPARVGMTGGSYSGFMANWIVGHTDRFAAVASQRSIANFISKCLTTDIGYYHNLCAVQSDPWNSPEEMWNRSPLKYADKCTTPTLFIQSDEGLPLLDGGCPSDVHRPADARRSHPRLPVPRRKPRAFPQRQTKAPRQKAQRDHPLV